MDQPNHVGMTRRELEREVAWMMKRLPDDPREFVKLLCQSMVALIDKNNAAIAKALEHREEQTSTTTMAHQESKT